MLTLFKTIAQLVNSKVPAIRWIDIYKRQLEDEEEYNTIVIPGLLISLPDTTWQESGRHNQRGDALLTTRLCLRLPAQTHATDPTYYSNLDQLDLEDQVHQAILCLPSAQRLKTKTYSVMSLFVVENTYQLSLDYTYPARTLKKLDANVTKLP